MRGGLVPIEFVFLRRKFLSGNVINLINPAECHSLLRVYLYVHYLTAQLFNPDTFIFCAVA